jgi:hypothetical protein
MATSIDRPTLLDVARMLDPDGKPAQIIEILNESNPILQDAPAYPSNAPMGHRVTLRSSLPQVEFAKINQGATRSKGSTRQVTETMGFVQGLSEVDSKLLKVVGSAAFDAKRRTEDMGFLESMSQLVASTIMYGDETINEAAFTGLQPRLETPSTAITESQVIAMSNIADDVDRTSIYVVDWGERGAHLIYPPASTAGIDSRDLGEQRVEDGSGRPMSAYVQVYEWLLGLSVEDPRHIGRLANIDVSDSGVVTNNVSAPTQGLLVHKLSDLLSGMPAENGMKRVMYCHKDVLASFRKQALNNANTWITMETWLGKLEPHLWGIPLRRLDAITKVEGTVS